MRRLPPARNVAANDDLEKGKGQRDMLGAIRIATIQGLPLVYVARGESHDEFDVFVWELTKTNCETVLHHHLRDYVAPNKVCT